MRRILSRIAAAVSICVSAAAQTPADIDKARASFAEAEQVSDHDDGKLWGQPLYGPMLVVDPVTRAVMANEADDAGALHKEGDVYAGRLPDTLALGYTSVDWGGKRWTMLLLPLPADTLLRRTAMGHEMFHRIEPGLGIKPINVLNLHLDTSEGRIWIELEWRALAAALATQGEVQEGAIRDALAFRAHRQALFAGSAESERMMEIVEGLAEYTGLVAAASDRGAMLWNVMGRLTRPDAESTFVRTFIFTSVPAYGLLLDERQPGWRRSITQNSDLGAMLRSTLKRSATASAEEAAQRYGATAIRAAETERAAVKAAEKARFHKLLVEGPTLTLPNAGQFNFSFNTTTIVSLGDDGAVYPTFHATDAWGTLDVKDGALVPTDYSKAVLPAPSKNEGQHLEGPGWTLDLAPGWRAVPESKTGSFVVRKA
ncbi:MAG TPA: hypothetical protein VMU01_11405 [Rhizomicrobium sp.]|nr:hypothetical protein [Rhizomicrobium sp.]